MEISMNYESLSKEELIAIINTQYESILKLEKERDMWLELYKKLCFPYKDKPEYYDRSAV